MRKAGPVAEEPFNSELVTNWQPGVSKAQAAVGGQSVVFFNRPVLNPSKSAEEGRPRYDPTPFVRISQPGDRDNVVVRQVWLDPNEFDVMADNVRFREKWEAFLAGESAVDDGTPLELWPAITPEQKAELKHFNIRTVEQLANLADVNAQKFMGIRALKQLAKDFLDAAKDGAVVTKLNGELDKLQSDLRDQKQASADQAETIRQLREMVEAQQRAATRIEAVSRHVEAIDPEVVHTPKPVQVEEKAPSARPFLRPTVKKE